MPEPANYFQPYNPIFNSNGVPVPGAQVFFYTSTANGDGTSTKAAIYADADLTVELPNPVTANSASRLPAIYLEKDKFYRVVTRSAPDVYGNAGRLLEEIDPFVPGEYPAGPPGPPGAAGNVAANLEQLKAAPTSNVTMIYNGKTFAWVTGDFSGYANDTTIVESDDNALTTGAWVQQADSYSVFDFIPKSEQIAIQTRSSSYDATDDIQVAITVAAALRRQLLVPSGTYMLDPQTIVADEDTSYATYTAFRIPSGMNIAAEVGAIFKIKNGRSTNAAPVSMGMFSIDPTDGDSGHVVGVTIRNLEMDMNGSNNPISPNRLSGSYNRYNQAQILVSGTAGGVAARMSDVVIDNCTFRDCPGACCIVGAQSNVTGVALGRNWAITNCRFIDNGRDTDDHSSVFGWYDDGVLDNCRFIVSVPFGAVPGSGGKTGGTTCYEIHGSNHTLTRNYFGEYARGVYVSSNLSTPVYNSIIQANTFEALFYGIDFFGESAVLSRIFETIIATNQFNFDDTAVAAIPGLNFKTAIVISSPYAQQAIKASGNSVTKTGAQVACNLATIAGGDAGTNRHTDININGNKGTGLTFGCFVRTPATAGFGKIDTSGNDYLNLTPTPTFSVAQGDAILSTLTPQPIKVLTIGGGSCIDDRATPQAGYAIRLNEVQVEALNVKTVVATGLTIAVFEENNSTVAGRKGNFPRAVTAPVWKAGGAAITLGNGDSKGLYVIRGDMILFNASLTIGSTTTVGSGTLAPDLPMAAALSGWRYAGSFVVNDASDSNKAFCGTVTVDGTATSPSLWNHNSATPLFQNNAPITLASGDRVTMQVEYVAS